MTDLVDMFEVGFNEDNINEDKSMDPLDFANAVGLAESFLDINDQVHNNVESLFDNDEETHKKAERISLKGRNNEQNIPAFERMVMRQCGML